ncbi:RidA family protein [Allopusillimonas soli]|uniref:RidA family protein n=1 Tax=Allopusillimonas soli TaxID=659016 RepID=A0A853FCB1_9BURK|nr:RidA family protein [Allopusillimonas soli]NYT36181.1 RidA family protein [Allopusillimonas soli]TEA76514.1 RidA family protein [Allopusillimonas soli]
MKILQPPFWTEPRGYANGIMTEMQAGSRLLFIGGQIGWNAQQEFETEDFAEQVGQTLRNIVAVLAEGGAGPEHIARMTWYVCDKKEYMESLQDIGRHYREVIGRHYPAMTAIEVADLVEDQAKVEIEVTAVVPPAA